jgi:pentatricopeptide repeat protein
MKKDLKALFSAIRKHENQTVRSLLAQDPSLVNACASAPPKKDDGQSPLQVAFKTANFEIAGHLIDLGANIHFMEQSELNEWRTPVLHDALRAAAFTARDGNTADNGKFETALGLLRRMLSMGVNPNAVDSYGNNALLRALMDSRQRLSVQPGFPDKVANETLNRDLREILQTLLKAGADIHASSPQRESAIAAAREPALAALIQ